MSSLVLRQLGVQPDGLDAVRLGPLSITSRRVHLAPPEVALPVVWGQPDRLSVVGQRLVVLFLLLVRPPPMVVGVRVLAESEGCRAIGQGAVVVLELAVGDRPVAVVPRELRIDLDGGSVLFDSPLPVPLAQEVIGP